MVQVLNHGALNLGVGIGYRLGLFEAMEALDGPAPAWDIAEKAGLSSRYVREWLGCMACGGVVEVSRNAEGNETYCLPPEHAALLCKSAGNRNLGVYMQELPLLANIAMDGVESGFRTGDGVDYSRYPRFHAFMSELSNAKHRQVLVDLFLPSVDDGRLEERLRQGIRVLDMGCGEGVATILMAEAFPASTFLGLDFHGPALDAARGMARERGLDNVEFVAGDAAEVEHRPDWAGRFDYVVAFDSVHDQARPLEALRGVRHALAPGGMFSMVDIAARTAHSDNLGHPMGPFLYAVSLMHCMPVGLVDGGMGLGMMWGEERALELLAEAGFTRVDVVDMPHDPFNSHYLCRV